LCKWANDQIIEVHSLLILITFVLIILYSICAIFILSISQGQYDMIWWWVMYNDFLPSSKLSSSLLKNPNFCFWTTIITIELIMDSSDLTWVSADLFFGFWRHMCTFTSKPEQNIDNMKVKPNETKKLPSSMNHMKGFSYIFFYINSLFLFQLYLYQTDTFKISRYL